MGFLNDSRKKTEVVMATVMVRARVNVKGRVTVMVRFRVRVTVMVRVRVRVTVKNKTLREKMSFNKIFLMGSIKNKQPDQ